MRKETIGDCTLYLGDCLEVLPEIAPVNAVLADPPYKMEIHGRGFAEKRDYYKKLDYGTTPDFELSEEYYDLILSKLTEVNIVLFCNKLMKLDIENFAVGRKFTFDEIVLLKEAPAPLTNNQWLPDKEFAVHVFRKCSVKGGYDTKKTWFVNPNYKDTDIDHPSPKPLYIVERILKNITNEGDVVLDTFMGSGTTGVAALKNGRKFVGIEIDEKFFDLSCRRIEEAYKQADLFAPEIKAKKNSEFNFEGNQ